MKDGLEISVTFHFSFLWELAEVVDSKKRNETGIIQKFIRLLTDMNYNVCKPNKRGLLCLPPLFFTAAVEDWNEDHLLTAERGGGTFPFNRINQSTLCHSPTSFPYLLEGVTQLLIRNRNHLIR